MSTEKNVIAVNEKGKELKEMILMKRQLQNSNNETINRIFPISNNSTSDQIVYLAEEIPKSDIHQDEPAPKRIKIEETCSLHPYDPLIMDENTVDELAAYNDEGIKKFIRDEIRQSERRIHSKLDRIERKLNFLLGTKLEDFEMHEKASVTEEQYTEEHIVDEYVSKNGIDNVDHGIIDEYSNLIFPIDDESTFDWFMDKLREDEYRSNLIDRRWILTRSVGTRSFNVSVKDFILMHVNLGVCIKYSVSGLGSRGTKKKKLDSRTLCYYIVDCFNRSQPDLYSMDEVSKAITQFWGRTQDIYTKMHDRALRREVSN